MLKADAIVLGAGIVGVSVAVHLQKRGRATVLVDRRAPGEETSFGNAGLIQREAVYPYAFPRDFKKFLTYALNRSAGSHYHWRALPKLAPFLIRYWWHSSPARHAAIAQAYARLIERSVDEHLSLAAEAGSAELLRPTGWILLYRTPSALDEAVTDAERLREEFGIRFRALDRRDLAEAEPHLGSGLTGGIHYTQPVSVSDPHALTLAYVRLFEHLGGRSARGDARTLEATPQGWQVQTESGSIEAKHVVVALGAWSDVVARAFGYRVPLATKRGYHVHFQPRGNAVLNHTVLDDERGYVLAPMAQGIRLTTGAEFAARDAPKTPVQLAKAEPLARDLFPLAERIEAEPWMGLRPCLPDMMPVIGPAPRHPGLWFAFGHAHHGLTLGPVTGRLMAEMMTGAAPFTDPAPYRVDRF